MIDLLNDRNIADAMTTVARCLLVQAGIPFADFDNAEITRFAVDVNRIVIEIDGVSSSDRIWGRSVT